MVAFPEARGRRIDYYMSPDQKSHLVGHYHESVSSVHTARLNFAHHNCAHILKLVNQWHPANMSQVHVFVMQLGNGESVG
jgi:hypothetical protein